MLQQRDSALTPTARLEALKTRHQDLEKRIEIQRLRPSTESHEIGKLKREKLKLKEEIEGIRKVS
jgi:hypothetical protein